ncbi:MAG: hypothetical protein QW051_01335 [Candidatus Aenigmatarchaeota archaeon]
MKQKYYLVFMIIAVIGIILIAGCVQQFTRNEIQFIDMNEQLTCIDSFELRDGEFIINSDQEYQVLLDYKSPSPGCENFHLPSIDFSQYTLLGKYAEGGGCSIVFVRKIYKDESNKEITYSIKVEGKGYCEKLGMSMNWALIPKVPSDYNVKFEVK